MGEICLERYTFENGMEMGRPTHKASTIIVFFRADVCSYDSG